MTTPTSVSQANGDQAKRDADAKAKIAGLLKTVDVLESGGSPEQTVTEASDEAAKQAAAPARASDGKFAAKDGGKPEGEKAATKAEPAKAQMSDETRAAYEAARATLRRDKVPQRLIDAESPEALIAWAKEVEPRHKQQDEHARQLGELKKHVETKAVKPESVETNKQSGPAEQPVDFKAVVQPLAKKLALVEDDEIAALAGFAQQVFDTATKQALMSTEAKIKSLGLDRLNAAVAEIQMERARAELTGRYSSLADGTEYGEVVDAMLAKLDKLKKEGVPAAAVYSGMSDLMNEVCAVRYVEKLQAEAAGQKHKKVHSDRDSGRAEKPTQPAPKGALTRDDRNKALIGDMLRDKGIV